MGMEAKKEAEMPTAQDVRRAFGGASYPESVVEHTKAEAEAAAAEALDESEVTTDEKKPGFFRRAKQSE